MKRLVEGILPALVTPLTADGELAVPALEQLIERLYGAGVDGLYVCGQTGEGLLLPVAMRQQIVEVAARNSPAGKTVVAHVGTARTTDAVALARHAARTGAHAIASLPPLGPYRFDEVRAYYERLAGAGLPLLVYYFPEVAPQVSADQVGELTQIPNVIGAKFTDFDLFRLSRLAQQGVTMLNGRDEVLVAGLLMGAHGGVGTFYNVVPELFVALYAHARRQEWTEARRVQDRVNELIAITLHFPMLPAVKAMLGWSGIDCGLCVEPRRALTADEQDQLAGKLAAAGFAAHSLATADA